jgi:hypothetical protein
MSYIELDETALAAVTGGDQTNNSGASNINLPTSNNASLLNGVVLGNQGQIDTAQLNNVNQNNFKNSANVLPFYY